MDLDWTQEYPYNQYFQDNGVTGSIPLCIAKLLVYEEIDADISGVDFSGHDIKRGVDTGHLYMAMPAIAQSINSRLIQQLFRYSPTDQGLSFLRSHGFYLYKINRDASVRSKKLRIQGQITQFDHPVIVLDGCNWVLIEGIKEGSDLLLIDEISVGNNKPQWQSYDLTDKVMYQYFVEDDNDIHLEF